jgi:hypothetical protein
LSFGKFAVLHSHMNADKFPLPDQVVDPSVWVPDEGQR